MIYIIIYFIIGIIYATINAGNVIVMKKDEWKEKHKNKPNAVTTGIAFAFVVSVVLFAPFWPVLMILRLCNKLRS